MPPGLDTITSANPINTSAANLEDLRASTLAPPTTQDKRNLTPMDVESASTAATVTSISTPGGTEVPLESPTFPHKDRHSGTGIRRSSFGVRASSLVGPRVSIAAERASVMATKAAHDFVQTPKRRAHRATVTFDENAETPRAPLQREESAFIGAGRVGAAVLSKQLSGTGHYGVESDTSPYVAVALVVACLAIFAWEMVEQQPYCDNSVVETSSDSGTAVPTPTPNEADNANAIFGVCFEDRAINPFYGPSVEVLLKLGAKRQDEIVQEGQYWRLLTANFLHGGLVHIAMNMLGLYGLAAGAERAHGHFAVLLVFISSGFFSFMISCIFTPDIVAVGASGSIFGLLGSLYGHIFQNWGQLDSPCCDLTGLVIQTIISLVIGLAPQIDNFCHVGGFYFGILAGLCVFVTPDFDPRTGEELPISAKKGFLKMVGFVAAFMSMVIACSMMVYYEDNPFEICTFCHHFSCYEIPDPFNGGELWKCGACYQEAWYPQYFYQNATLVMHCPSSSYEAKVRVDRSEDPITSWYEECEPHDQETPYCLCEKYCDTWY